MRSFYLGCHECPGHYLWRVHEGRLYDARGDWQGFPFSWRSLDGGFLPQVDQTEGVASVVHFPGWSVLTFWDRSVDTRPGCNSSFVFNQPGMSFDELVEQAKQTFPMVWERFDFEVTEYVGVQS